MVQGKGFFLGLFSFGGVCIGVFGGFSPGWVATTGKVALDWSELKVSV